MKVLFLFFLTLPCLAQEPQPLEKVIAEFQARYVQSLKDGNAAANAECYNLDAFVLNPGEPLIHGRDSIRLSRQAIFDQVQVVHAVVHTTHLESSGNLAYEVGEFSYSLKYKSGPKKGEARTVGGKFLMVWKRAEDGVWRYQADAGLAD